MSELAEANLRLHELVKRLKMDRRDVVAIGVILDFTLKSTGLSTSLRQKAIETVLCDLGIHVHMVANYTDIGRFSSELSIG